MSLDDTMLWLRAREKMMGTKRHTRLGVLGPGFIRVKPVGFLEDPDDYHGYDGLSRLHGTTSNKEGGAAV